ncbi:unnamed protein product [Calicophoron daubneyi]|uniref:Uncharacterized protein n=1 Tax=Calicophoron daubneyi TaxID=300641 RepID=A0AAV2TYC8_CALDB
MYFKMILRLLIPCPILLFTVFGLLVQLRRRRNRFQTDSYPISSSPSTKRSSYDEAITSANLMICVGILVLLTSAAMFVSIVVNLESDMGANIDMYCSTTGILYAYTSLITWSAVCLKNFVLIFGVSRARQDVASILALLTCRSRVNSTMQTA